MSAQAAPDDWNPRAHGEDALEALTSLVRPDLEADEQVAGESLE